VVVVRFVEPVSTVVPGLHGQVLGVLARTEQPLTGRAVAGLLRGAGSASGVQKVLDDLVSSGVVISEPAGRARLYVLNREHVAYEAIDSLARLRDVLLERIRAEVESWPVPAKAVWLFGSTARAEGDVSSDLDLLIVRPDDIDESDPRWLEQLEKLSTHATAWSGNSCEIVEYAAADLAALVARGERLADELRRDAVPIAGSTPHRTLTRKAS